MRTNRRVTVILALFAAVSLNSAAWAQSQSYQSAPNSFAGSGPGLSAGGLAPPGSGTGMSAGYDPGQTQSAQSSLQQADRKDSGRGLKFIWLNGEVGVQTLSLNTFHANNLVDANTVATSQTGPVYGAGAGLQLVFLTLGGRFRLGDFTAWQLWTLDAELGLHMPLGKLEPYFSFAAGYASMGSFSGASSAFDYKNSGIGAHGWNARMGVGLDFYPTHFFSIGALLSGDVLYLKRSTRITIAGAESDPTLAKAQQVYANDGSSLGGAATVTAVIGLHF